MTIHQRLPKVFKLRIIINFKIFKLRLTVLKNLLHKKTATTTTVNTTARSHIRTLNGTSIPFKERFPPPHQRYSNSKVFKLRIIINFKVFKLRLTESYINSTNTPTIPHQQLHIHEELHINTLRRKVAFSLYPVTSINGPP